MLLDIQEKNSEQILMADRRHWLLSIKMVDGDNGWNDRNCNEEDCSLRERFRNRPGFAAGCRIPGDHPEF